VPLGGRLFEEKGKVTSISIESVHPVEGTKVKVDFVSEIKGTGNFPSGQNMGLGIMNQYPHGVWDSSYHGVITTREGEQFMWWGHEKSRVGESGQVRGLVLITGFTHSQKLSWLNKLIMAAEIEFNPQVQEFAGTGYEWK